MTPVPIGRIVAYGFAALTLVIVLLVGGASGCKAWSRYQKRADAKNEVSINHIRIRQQVQRVLIAKQEAQIRYQRSVGVRRAQDEIAKTLTPLYVQFEMVQALQSIAGSGKNNSVVFIPAGANGIPLVSTLDATKVGQPDQAGK